MGSSIAAQGRKPRPGSRQQAGLQQRALQQAQQGGQSPKGQGGGQPQQGRIPVFDHSGKPTGQYQQPGGPTIMSMEGGGGGGGRTRGGGTLQAGYTLGPDDVPRPKAENDAMMEKMHNSPRAVAQREQKAAQEAEYAAQNPEMAQRMKDKQAGTGDYAPGGRYGMGRGQQGGGRPPKGQGGGQQPTGGFNPETDNIRPQQGGGGIQSWEDAQVGRDQPPMSVDERVARGTAWEKKNNLPPGSTSGQPQQSGRPAKGQGGGRPPKGQQRPQQASARPPKGQGQGRPPKGQ